MMVSDAGGRPSADEPLDDADFGLLDDIRRLFEAADPMPNDLPERIRFSLALRDLGRGGPGGPGGGAGRVLLAGGEKKGGTFPLNSNSLTIITRIDATREG